MDPVKALTLDYESTLDFIDKCDNHIFTIKNWALITSSAVIAFSISTSMGFIVLVNLLLIPAFLYLELIHKSFQDSAIEHTTDISERIDRSLSPSSTNDLTEGYKFGFGRRLQYPSIGRCAAILRNKNRRHIVNFYGLIAAFSIGSFIVSGYFA